uniref:Peptidase C1A papain C-terminal domain-containing protein n=1 Tax=Strigamia maritima TaxID=126957 RepID=T1J1Q3_STRMM
MIANVRIMKILTLFLYTQFYFSISNCFPNQNDDTKDFRSKRAIEALNQLKLENLPKKLDWRDYGAVTAIKNQKNCGACWAFSTVETMESMKKIKLDDQLQELSVQQVIDCARGENNGCEGGDTCTVLEWMDKTRFNLTSENDYPLTDVQATCKAVESATRLQLEKNFTCNSYVGDEEAMIKLLADHGPLVAAVDATTWQDYLGGIIQYHCGGITNHAVQIVGYDLTGKKYQIFRLPVGEIPFYIVRNSWGSGFGLDGYLHIEIGKNLCEIATRVSTLSVH